MPLANYWPQGEFRLDLQLHTIKDREPGTITIDQG
jgi:hypothetical protein